MDVRSGRGELRALVHFAAVGLLLVGALSIAVRSPVLAAVVVAGSVLASLLVTFGTERTATVVVVTAVFLSPMNALRPLGGGVVTASDLALVVGLTVLVPVVLGRRLRLPTTFVLGHLLIVVIGLAVSMTADDAGVSVNFLARLIAGALIIPLMLMWWCPPRAVINVLASSYVAGSAVSTVYGYVVTGPVQGRYVGLTGHPNALGMTAMLAVGISLYLLSEARPAWRPWAVAALAVSLLGVFGSGSRASLLVAGVLVALYPLLNRSFTAAVAIALAGIVGIARFGVIGQEITDGNAISRLLGGGAADASDLERNEALRVAFAELRDRPFFGGGFESALEAHNLYLQVAVSIGIIGLVGYLLVMFTLVRPLLGRLEPGALILLPGLAYVAVGMLSNILWDRYVWCALAVCLAGWVSRQQEEPTPADPSPVEVEPVRAP